MPKTLFDKIWEAHEVADGLLYIDLHLVHEVTSAAGVRGAAAGRPPGPPPGPHARDRRPQRADRRRRPPPQQIRDQLSRVQVETLERNCARVRHPDLLDRLARARASCT